MLGMGFESNRVPLDFVTILLAGQEFSSYHLLLVDEFLRFNGESEGDVVEGVEKTKSVLSALMDIYGVHANVLVSSDFMCGSEYAGMHVENERAVFGSDLAEKLRLTVPERFRNHPDALKYAINEITCVDYLRDNFDIQVKLGPNKERIYDEVMHELAIDVGFGYLMDAFAFGTRYVERVVHYLSSNTAGGVRLLLSDHPRRTRDKLYQGPVQALRAYAKVASVAGKVLGQDSLEDDEIDGLIGKKLKKATVRLVMQNIVEPYKGVMQDD
jgi:hypothetical protein